MPDLIFSRAAGDRFLSTAEIERMAPAVFTETKADHLTSRYGQVTTANAIEVLADYGLFPTQAAQVPTRGKGNTGEHSAHLLAFAKKGTELTGNDHRGEVLLYNSHDGKSALKLFAGAYRFVCSNGIVAGEGFEAKLRHTSTTASSFEDMLRETAGNIPELLSRIETMQGRSMTEPEAIDMAYNAASLRWEFMPEQERREKARSEEGLSGIVATERTIEQMLKPRRWNDRELTEWGVFNRIQESLMRGGVFAVSHSAAKPLGQSRKVRPVASVRASVDINRRLWDLVADHNSRRALTAA